MTPIVFSVTGSASDHDRVTPFFAFVFRLCGVVLILCLISGRLQAGAPEINVEQAAVAIPDGGAASLGSIALGANSPAMVFTILNEGDEILTDLAVAKDGANPGDFIISAPATSVAGGASSVFTVTFTPTAAGVRSCVLHVSSNDADENPYDITLSGTGASTAPLVIAQSAYFKSSNPVTEDYFGYSVAVSGETVVVGVPYATANNTGAVHVFTRTGGVWTQQASLAAGNPGPDDLFGYSVGISGDTLVVGALSEDSSTAGVNGIPNENASNSGAAYVFTRSAGIWSQQGFLKAGNPGAGDQFGESVAVSGDTVVVGAKNEDSSTPGVNSVSRRTRFQLRCRLRIHAHRNRLDAASLSEIGKSRRGRWVWWVSGGLGRHGRSRGCRGGQCTTGVNSAPNEFASGSGAAYVFTRTGSIWTQQAFSKRGTPAPVIHSVARWRSRATRSSSERPARTVARRGLMARPTNSP